MKGRRGFLPVCHTELARWAVENGYTAANIAGRIGINPVTVRRHFLGSGISPVVSRLYRTHFPGIPVPLKGRPEFFVHPLPIRYLPDTAMEHGPQAPALLTGTPVVPRKRPGSTPGAPDAP